MLRHIALLTFVLCLASNAQAALIGNDLSARDNAADGATTVFYTTYMHTPRAGTISDVSVFNQGAGTSFNLFVLRPTATPNQYNVVYDSGSIIPAGPVNTAVTMALPNGSFNVQPGDVFGHYGRGVPYSDNPGTNAVNPQNIYFSSPAAPVLATTITLGGASFPLAGFNRDYAIAVNVPTVREQQGFGTFEGGAVDGAAGVLGVLDDHAFTLKGQIDKWQFFSNSSATDRFVTPLLFKANGLGGFEITAIGTPRQNTNTGLQIYDFGVISGDETVGPGIFPGWWDGNFLTGIANQGVIEFDGAGVGTLPLFPEADGFVVGDDYGPGGLGAFGGSPFQRQYAVNFSSVQVPEPATALLMLLAAPLAARRRRVA